MIIMCCCKYKPKYYTVRNHLNPKNIGVKNWGVGGGEFTMSYISNLSYLLVKVFFHFELKLKVFVMTRAVSNRDIHFIKISFSNSYLKILYLSKLLQMLL